MAAIFTFDRRCASQSPAAHLSPTARRVRAPVSPLALRMAHAQGTAMTALSLQRCASRLHEDLC